MFMRTLVFATVFMTGLTPWVFVSSAQATGEPQFLDFNDDDTVSVNDTVKGTELDIGNLQSVWDTICTQDRNKSAVIRWQATQTEVLCLNLRIAMSTTIVFPGDQEVVTAILGDPRGFVATKIAQRPNMLHLRAQNITGADTQMTVVARPVSEEGNGADQVLTFYLRSYPVDTNVRPNLTVFVEPSPPAAAGDYVLDFEGSSQSLPPIPEATEVDVVNTATPAEMPLWRDDAMTGAKEGEWTRAIEFDADKLRFSDYKIYARNEDSTSIAPVRAFHDGVFTYLDFGEDGRSDRVLQPVAHLVVDGVDSRVNKRVVGKNNNILVVEAVGTITLRNGARVVCVVYQGSPVKKPNNVVVGLPGGDDNGQKAAREQGATRSTDDPDEPWTRKER